MIPLQTHNLVIRSDTLRDCYRGGWEQFTRDFYRWPEDGGEYRDPIVRLGAADDLEVTTLLQRLKQHGLKLGREGGGAADIAFLRDPVILGPVPHCPWLHLIEHEGEPHAAFVGVPDPRWQKHRVRVRWGKWKPFGWHRADDLFLHAAELADAPPPERILARALTRLALEDMIRDDYALLQMQHGDGREALLHAYGEFHGFDVPYVMAPPDYSIGSSERGVGTPFRNFTEIINAGWLAASCANELEPPFEGISLLEVDSGYD